MNSLIATQNSVSIESESSSCGVQLSVWDEVDVFEKNPSLQNSIEDESMVIFLDYPLPAKASI